MRTILITCTGVRLGNSFKLECECDLFTKILMDSMQSMCFLSMSRTIASNSTETFCKYHSFALYHAQIDLAKDIDPDQKPLLIPPCPTLQDIEIPFDMPIGFRILYEQELIGQCTVALTNNLMVILEEQECSTTDKTQPQPEISDLPSSFMNTWGLLHLQPSSVLGEPSVEDVLPTAVTMYTSRVVAGPLRSINVTGRCAQSHLVSQLILCVRSRTIQEENALFWSWIVAVESLKTRLGELSPCGLELRDMLAERFGHFRPPVNARLVLEQFFCDNELWSDYIRLILPIWSRKNTLSPWI